MHGRHAWVPCSASGGHDRSRSLTTSNASARVQNQALHADLGDLGDVVWAPAMALGCMCILQTCVGVALLLVAVAAAVENSDRVFFESDPGGSLWR